MKIIDAKTGKRLTDVEKEMISHAKTVDPVTRNVEKGLEEEEFSPMDPPDAYGEKAIVKGVEYADMSELLKHLIDEHKELEVVVSEFEKALIEFHKEGYFISKETNDSFNKFFVFFDEHIIPHNRKEERYLFPILHKKLIESGEHGVGENPSTAVDLMEDDHVKFIQLASLTFNILGLGIRLTDPQSRGITFDLAYHSGKELVELLRLHIFREDNTLFPLAQKLIPTEEFGKILSEIHD